MSNTGNENYINWKHWDAEKFAAVVPGARFYFDQIFKNKSIPDQCNILELGYGNGELLGYFRSLGHKVIGVEINAHLVERAINAGYEAYQAPIGEATALQHKQFDLIVAIDVAEHMSFVELNELFSWAGRHLNKGGKLILRFPEGASPFGLAYQHGDFTHVTSLTKGKIVALCYSNNLQLESYEDEVLRSNKLCAYGLFGKLILRTLQLYASTVRWSMRILFYPLAIDLKLSTNSIAVIATTET